MDAPAPCRAPGSGKEGFPLLLPPISSPPPPPLRRARLGTLRRPRRLLALIAGLDRLWLVHE